MDSFVRLSTQRNKLNLETHRIPFKEESCYQSCSISHFSVSSPVYPQLLPIARASSSEPIPPSENHELVHLFMPASSIISPQERSSPLITNDSSQKERAKEAAYSLEMVEDYEFAEYLE
jgi:hypothetical protein